MNSHSERDGNCGTTWIVVHGYPARLDGREDLLEGAASMRLMQVQGPADEGPEGPREDYKVSSSGLYAIFGMVPSKSAGERKPHGVLALSQLRCLAKNE